MPLPSDLPPVSDYLEFLSPLSSDRADRLAQFMGRYAHGTVVDVGCGWASLLLRVLAASGQVRGIGIDLDRDALDHARNVAVGRGVGDRLELVAGKAMESLPARAHGAVCIGASHAWWTAEPSEPQSLDYLAALSGLRQLVEPGSPVVYGEGIWSSAPTEAAIKPLGGRLDEFVFLPELIELARDAGFVVMHVHEASLDEWDAFESGFTAGYADWLIENEADHPSYEAVQSRLSAQQEGYYRGYRGVLGFAYLCLRAI